MLYYVLTAFISAFIGFVAAALLAAAKRGDLLSEIKFLQAKVKYLEKELAEKEEVIKDISDRLLFFKKHRN